MLVICFKKNNIITTDISFNNFSTTLIPCPLILLITIISPLRTNYFIHVYYTLSWLLLLGYQLPKGKKR